MSKNHEGQWHYERVETVAGVIWRVADHDDDQISAWSTEADAREVVRTHNAGLVKNPRWLY